MRRTFSGWALIVAVGMLLCGVYLVVDRGGLLAWLGVALAAALLLKGLRWPSPADVLMSLATVSLWAGAWAATWYYVVTTWESGEVVEVNIDGGHRARVWVLDLSDGPVMYYDAPPQVAEQVRDGVPMTVTRGQRLQTGCARASRVEQLPEARVQEVLDAMTAKYRDSNRATDVFYAVLGGKRNRVGVLMSLAPCG